MKKVIWLAAVGLVLGVGLTSARADMYRLDTSTAQGFVQQNTPDITRNQLYLVVDKPGTLGSHVDWQYSPSWKKYGPSMQGEVGFLGQLADDDTMLIGTQGALPGGTYDSFGLFLANDDDDYWSVRPYLTGASYNAVDFTNLAPGDSTFIVLDGISGDVTGFGFELQYEGERGSDNFHISAVPIPGAALLGLLGLTAAGVRLRRFV